MTHGDANALVADQSPEINLGRIASYLRSTHWKPQRTQGSVGKTGVGTQVFLMHSITDPPNQGSQDNEAYMHLTSLGFTVHLKILGCQDRDPRKEAINCFINGMVNNKLGPWRDANSQEENPYY